MLVILNVPIMCCCNVGASPFTKRIGFDSPVVPSTTLYCISPVTANPILFDCLQSIAFQHELLYQFFEIAYRHELPKFDIILDRFPSSAFVTAFPTLLLLSYLPFMGLQRPNVSALGLIANINMLTKALKSIASTTVSYQTPGAPVVLNLMCLEEIHQLMSISLITSLVVRKMCVYESYLFV